MLMRNFPLLCCLILALGLIHNAPASAQAIPGTPLQVVDSLGQPVGFLVGASTFSSEEMVVSIEINGEPFLIEVRPSGVVKYRMFFESPGCTGPPLADAHFRPGGWFGRLVVVDGLNRAWSTQGQATRVDVLSKIGHLGVCTTFATPKNRLVRSLTSPSHGTLPNFDNPLRLQGRP